MMAAIGCAIILATSIGSTSLLNAIAPSLIAGMNATVTTYSFGPMLATICAFLGSLVGAKFIMRIGPRRCLLIGTVCVTIVMCIIASAVSTPLWYAANIINGVVLAIGAHAAVAGVLSEHYGERTPTVFGIVVGAMSFLVAFEVMVESFLLANMDYRTVLYVFAAAIFVLGVFSNLVLIGKLPSEKVGKAAPAQSQGEAAEQIPCAEAAEVPGITVKEALKTPTLYLFFAAMVLASFPLNGYSAYASYYFVGNGMDDAVAVSMLSLFAFVVAIISLFSGSVSKKLGASITSAIVFLGFAAGVAVMIMWAGSGSMPLAYTSLILCALIGPAQILPALFIPQLFGMKDYTSINSLGMGGYYLGGAITFAIVAAVMQGIGYSMGFIVLAASGIGALILFLAAIATSPMKKAASKTE